MKKSVLFGSNSQVLALFDMNYVLLSFDFNSEKSVYTYLCLLVILWVLVLFDMTSEKVSIGRQWFTASLNFVWYELRKKCSCVFGSNCWKVSVLFDLKSEKCVCVCLLVTLWKCRILKSPMVEDNSCLQVKYHSLIWTLKKVFTFSLVVTLQKCCYYLIWTLKKSLFTFVCW